MPIFKEDFYYYDKNSNSQLFHLHSFGKLYPDPTYIISRKENRDTIVECVLDGTGYIEYEGIVTTVEKGDCYIIKPGKGHSYYADDKNPYTKLWFSVSGEMISRWMDLYNINTPVFIRELDITPYYNQIKQTALGRNDLDNEKKLMLLIHDILFEMGMTAPKTSKQQRSDTHYIKTNANVILDVRKYIEKMCNERLSMKEVAAKFGLSQNTMNYLFKIKYGISPNKYHMQCKLESAAYFLEFTDLTVDMISETTGFFDRSHFRKSFMRQYGQTPAEYRKNYLKDQ